MPAPQPQDKQPAPPQRWTPRTLPLTARLMRLDSLPPNEQLLSPAPSAALVHSVERFGVLVPILLDDRGGVIDGRRRVKAARRAGLEEITAYVVTRPLTPAERSVLILTTNQLRSQNLVATLAAIEDLQARGQDQSQICAAAGLEPARYKRVLGLLRLIPALRTALAEGRLTEATAEDASRLEPDRQHALLHVLAAQGRLKRTDVRDLLSLRRQDAAHGLPDAVLGPQEPPQPAPGVLGQAAPHERAAPLVDAPVRSLLLDFAAYISARPNLLPALSHDPEPIVDRYLGGEGMGQPSDAMGTTPLTEGAL